jgi:hypothetical protein
MERQAALNVIASNQSILTRCSVIRSDMFNFIHDRKLHASVFLWAALIGAVQIGNTYEYAKVDGDYGSLWFSVPILFGICMGLVGTAKEILEEVLDNRDELRLDSSHQPNNE